MNASTCVVCGATGRGKTTVVNGLVRETLREEILLGADDEDARARTRADVDEVRRTTTRDERRRANAMRRAFETKRGE